MDASEHIFLSPQGLQPTPGIRERAQACYLRQELAARFGGDAPQVLEVSLHEDGVFRGRLRKIAGLPPYIQVVLRQLSGGHWETVTVWVPLAWNDRFMGTGGGGTATGGQGYISRPDNYERGQTLPKALLNGFAAGTTDGGNPQSQWGLDKVTGKLDLERVKNWHGRSTHHMTLAGKAVAEILHRRPVRYSYFHGGSGGGRQAMVLAQEYPEDYDGIWATCPAIHWSKFLVCGLWPNAVMNTLGHTLTRKKLALFTRAAQDTLGGREAYCKSFDTAHLDPFSLVGTNGITREDAQVMQQLWDGPRDASGERLWYWFRPGVQCWNHIIPVGAFYYGLFGRVKPFFLSVCYCRWLTENPKDTFADITVDGFRELFRESVQKLGFVLADKTDLSAFARRGGRLLIDHGIDDPLIPVDGTIFYYERLCADMGGREETAAFCRLFINPGDGHGNCRWHGPGITERDGMAALVRWVEQGTGPEELPVVQVRGKRIVSRETRKYY